MGEIRNLRLLSGEELIGEIIGESDEDVTVKNPTVFVVVPGQPTAENPRPQPVPNLFPWGQIIDPDELRKGIYIRRTFIVYNVKPVKQLEDHYRQMFGKLVIPGSGQRLFKPE